MCGKPKIPDIPEQKQFQQSLTPSQSGSGTSTSSGRRGTILTGGSGIKDPQGSTKKTVLGG